VDIINTKVWVIVEQRRNEHYRWPYDAKTGTFSRLPNKSLFYRGVFLRQDNDHKFVAVDEAIWRGMKTADISALDEVYYHELLQLYPLIGEGEGWFGAQVAFIYLHKKPMSD
jgi:hypothetical protein